MRSLTAYIISFFWSNVYGDVILGCMKIRKAEEEKKAMFGKKKDARVRVPSSPETRYQSARSSLLLVVVLTAINLLLLVMRSSTQFLFSASFPSYLYIIADEFADYLGMGTVLRLGALAVGVCDIGLYLLFWFLSKNARGFMTASLVLFCADCLAYLFGFLIFEFDASSVIEAVFHIWVLWTLIAGVRAARDLKRQEQTAMMMASTMTAEPEAPAQPEKPQSPAM